MSNTKFRSFAFYLLIYTLLVILWGAWVRISHSGDGCGDTWPLCNGQLIPEAQRGKTWVEFGHRLTSGLYGLIVIYFWWVARKTYPKGHFTRLTANFTLFFTITEALLGAKLVLFGLVATNASGYRALIIALHQLNSFMLTGAVGLAIASATLDAPLRSFTTANRRYALLPWLIVIVGVTGAWASLSNSLFPSTDLLSGFMQDWDKDSHFLIKLRVLHPILALTIGGYLIYFFWNKSQMATSFILQKKSLHLAAAFFCALSFGVMTLVFLAPVWMKIVHLTLAHVVWVMLLQWVFFVRKSVFSN